MPLSAAQLQHLEKLQLNPLLLTFQVQLTIFLFYPFKQEICLSYTELVPSLVHLRAYTNLLDVNCA